ncbi:hypothetical protein IQ63_32050 [Streptomyces acidiscabies]|uniref:Uncharacterized protein n=1 Tax=Streptomyces acidiscabies TaxID=42234 RepID=A0A0L0JTV1_9ACTN|nr:hypothetical protein IQ63_32050 [Streptomyces acidiscabies]
MFVPRRPVKDAFGVRSQRCRRRIVRVSAVNRDQGVSVALAPPDDVTQSEELRQKFWTARLDRAGKQL